MITTINQLKSDDIKGKKVLVRVDFNVPIKDGKVADDYRITRAMATIEFLRTNGAKVLLISHIETKGVEVPTLRPVFEYLSKQLSLAFIEDCFSDEGRQGIEMLEDGEMLLLSASLSIFRTMQGFFLPTRSSISASATALRIRSFSYSAAQNSRPSCL